MPIPLISLLALAACQPGLVPSASGIAVDGAGNLYLASRHDSRIWKVAPDGTISTLAGGHGSGYRDGSGGPNGTALFFDPWFIAADGSGNVYVAELDAFRIRKIAQDGSTTTLAGNGVHGYQDGTGGPNGTTEFTEIDGLAVDGTGTLYVSEFYGSRIRKVAPDGSTTTFAGNGVYGYHDGSGGPNGTAEFAGPAGIAVDSAGNVYVADYYDSRIRKIGPDGSTTTLAGNGAFQECAGTLGGCYRDGTGGPNGTTEFSMVFGLAIDGAGNLYVTDETRIRKVAPDGTTSTVAGNGTPGLMDGTGGPNGTAEFGYLTGIAVDTAGDIFVVDVPEVRKIRGGVVRTLWTVPPAPTGTG